MRPSFKGDALVYYVCGTCGVSKMEVQPKANPPDAESQPKPTGLVCVQCNKPYATIEERDG